MIEYTSNHKKLLQYTLLRTKDLLQSDFLQEKLCAAIFRDLPGGKYWQVLMTSIQRETLMPIEQYLE